MTSKKTLILAAGLFSLAGTLTAFAHGGATGIVKERMDAMSAMAKSVKSISEMFKSGDYDPQIVRDGANGIAAHAGEALTKLFPEGTEGAPSEARAEVWTQWQSFEKHAEELKTFAVALEQAADRQPAADAAGNTANGSSSMMGTSSLMGTSTMMGTKNESAPVLDNMPPDRLFTMVVNSCAACHDDYRIEKKQ